MANYRELLTIEPVFKTADGKVFKTISEAKHAADKLAIIGAFMNCQEVYLSDRQCELLATCLLKNFSFHLNPPGPEIDQEPEQQELPLELSQEIQQEADKLSTFVSGLTSMVG